MPEENQVDPLVSVRVKALNGGGFVVEWQYKSRFEQSKAFDTAPKMKKRLKEVVQEMVTDNTTKKVNA